MTDLLQQGIAAARAGKRAEARALLMRVVEADERNEQAWMWLSGVVDDPDDMRTCLHNALELNPNNTQARQGLAWVDSKYGPAPAAPSAPAAPTPAPAAPPAPEPPLSALPAAATPAPAGGPASTGPTTRLAPEPAARPQPPAPPAPAREPAASPPAPLVIEPDPYPCPYCGAPTTLEHDRCPQCRQDLMIRGAEREKRSLALTILGGLWVSNGVLTIIGGILGTLGALIIAQNALPPPPKGTLQQGNAFSLPLLIPIVFGIIIGAFIFRIGRGLLRRERWAYYVVIVLSALGLIGALANIAQLNVLAATLRSAPSVRASAQSARIAALAANIVTVVIFLIVGFQALYLLLIGLSYRDFFGPMVRFQPTLEGVDDMAHYNNGIAYKNRGMWYMAVQEWYAASRKKPHDKTYLQALGLAYAQIKKLYPAAPAYLQDVEGFLNTKRADLYAVAPELEQIKLLG
jgi:tetratricopeptide (TPR) repeat protein